MDISESPRSSGPQDFVALVPARSGSKGIFKKNLREVGGVSLLARAIRRARQASSIGRVLVSTDDADLAGLAVEEGAEVLGLRPAELARDDTPMSRVVSHIWDLLEGRGEAPAEGLVLLQPSSPLVRPGSVDRAVEVFRQRGAPVLKAVRKVREHPDWMLAVRDGLLVPYGSGTPKRRQELPGLFVPCGAIYIYGKSALAESAACSPASWIELDWPESLDVDEPEDLVVAQCLAVLEADAPVFTGESSPAVRGRRAQLA